MAFSKVDLPDPFGPMKAVTFPVGISKDTSSMTTFCP
jgi:hypothetical protein